MSLTAAAAQAIHDTYMDGLRALPAHMLDAVENYIEQGRLPGAFLRAVIANDFHDAVLFADDNNFASLKQWARFFHNDVPPVCWGSAAALMNWNKARGLKGLQEAAA